MLFPQRSFTLKREIASGATRPCNDRRGAEAGSPSHPAPLPLARERGAQLYTGGIVACSHWRGSGERNAGQ